MTFRVPGFPPIQKPSTNPQVNFRHPLARQLQASWLIPELGPSTTAAANPSVILRDGVGVAHATVDRLGVSFIQGPRGAVARYSGVGDSSVFIAAQAGTTYAAPMSLFTRVRVPSTGFRWFVTKAGGSWLGVSNLGKLVWTITPGLDELSNTTISDGLWHTVGMTLNGTTLKLWIDGVLDNTFTGVTLTGASLSSTMYFGHQGGFVENFNGDMEGVHLWGRSLDASEVSQLHTDPFLLYQNDSPSRYYLLPTRNLSATGARLTQVTAEVAVSGGLAKPGLRLTQVTAEVATSTPATGAITAYNAGRIQFFRYRDLLGPNALQPFVYDVVTNIGTAQLATDTDGIAPAGNTTYDQTPTITFQTTGAGGTGPFLYTWSVTISGSGTYQGAASGSTVLSGAVVATNRITLGHLAPASGYVLWVTAISLTGVATAIQPLLFSVLARRPPPAAPFVELPPFDLTPVAAAPTEYIRYLPRWMSVHGTATALPSAALLFQLLAPAIAGLQELAESGQQTAAQVALSLVPPNLPRLGWRLQTRLTAADAPLLSVRASGDVRALRRAESEFDFFTTDEPTYLLGTDGLLLLRNLSLREVTTGPVGVSGALLTQYQMPAEGEGMVPDANVLFNQGGVWYRIRGGSQAIDPARALVQLSPALSGTLTFRYQSLSYLPVLQIAVSGQPWASPGTLDFWNRFDEIGLLSGSERRPGEDNLTFRGRLTARLLAPPGNSQERVRLAVAADLVLTEVLGWDGLSRLDLAASGYVGVRAALIPDLWETESWSGRLYPDGDRRYFGPKRDWLPGWQVLVDGRPATQLTYPGLTTSGFVLDFGQSVSGIVTASYQYRQWEVERTDGFVTGITPVSGNVVSGAYQVLLSKNVQLFAPSDPEYQAEALLNADGTPNEFFLELKERLLTNSPVHFTRARWGDAYWFSDAEQQPQLSHLPLPLDRFTDSGSRST